MMRSLSSAVAGLKTHQTRMDVIGNNIANVNTYGFKSSRVVFSDVFYQTMSGGSQGTATRGGTNPTQIGYGSKIASIDNLMTQAGATTTNMPFDVYLDGEGFIAVQDPDGMIHYTRLGALGFDVAVDSGTGQTYYKLVDVNGNIVMGIPLDAVTGHQTGALDGTYPWGVGDVDGIILNNARPDGGSATDDKNVLQFLQSITINEDGTIMGVATEDFSYPAGSALATDQYKANEPFYIGKIAIATFPNTNGLTQQGSSYFDQGINSGDPTFAIAGKNGSAKTTAGFLEMSNVDISQEFTDMIITQRGFQANTRIITVSDEMLQELVNLKR